MKRLRILRVLALPVVVVVMALTQHSHLFAQSSPIHTALAARYFQEAQALWSQDNGKLWGISLGSPLLFVDRQTRAVVANQPDKEGTLSRSEDVFIGKLPENVTIANTTTQWAGVKWTMILLPLPPDKYRRANLIAHELWHRAQEQIGLPSSGAANNHLDSREGRLWLQLEWRALAAALAGRGKARRQAIEDALRFRAYRRTLFPTAASQEREMEMHEGLAEYTGVKLSGSRNLNRYVIDTHLKEAPEQQSFVRSFAYATGPAYGLLLDESGADWRKGLGKEADLGTLLQSKLGIHLPQNVPQAAQARAGVYDAAGRLEAAETARENQRRALLAQYRARLVDGPVLAIPLRKMSMQFNPGNLLPLESLGTVYPDIRVVDEWGILTVTKGALMNPTFTRIYVSAPARRPETPSSARAIQGDGWTLGLNAGWAIVAGERPGDYLVKNTEKKTE